MLLFLRSVCRCSSEMLLFSTDDEKEELEPNFSEEFILKMEEWERMKGLSCSGELRCTLQPIASVRARD